MSEPDAGIARIPILHRGGIDNETRPSQAFQDFLVEIRRHLHRNPELGFEEHQTSSFIRRVLEENGLVVHGPIAGTGLYVDVEGASAGPMIGYRADIDALPTADAKSVEYASTCAGVGHLCGHDAHSSIAIGIALLLHSMRDQLRGRVRIFFQPNEEGMPSGATAMIRDGVLDGLEAVYATHVDPSLEVGRFGLLAGPVTAATDQFRIGITSPSTGHSARPQETADTLWIAVQISNAIYQLVGRITDARNPAVLTICRFRGGDAYNVIPSEVEFGGTLRSTSAEDRKTLMDRIEHIATELAAAHGARAHVEFDHGSPPVVNDERIIEHLEHTIGDLFGRQAVFHLPRPSMGAEDFAHYVAQVPGALMRVGTYSGPRTSFPLHDAHFDIDENALAPTAHLLTRALRDHLERRILADD